MTIDRLDSTIDFVRWLDSLDVFAMKVCDVDINDILLFQPVKCKVISLGVSRVQYDPVELLIRLVEGVVCSNLCIKMTFLN